MNALQVEVDCWVAWPAYDHHVVVGISFTKTSWQMAAGHADHITSEATRRGRDCVIALLCALADTSCSCSSAALQHTLLCWTTYQLLSIRRHAIETDAYDHHWLYSPSTILQRVWGPFMAHSTNLLIIIIIIIIIYTQHQTMTTPSQLRFCPIWVKWSEWIWPV